MSLRSFFKGAVLVTASAALIAFVTLAGILVFTFYHSDGGQSWDVSVRKTSDALAWDGTDYAFTGEDLLADGSWAMLLDESGRVIWSLRKPSDVPEQYTLTQMPLWFGGIFLLALGCVLLLFYTVVRRWFRQAQQVRDAARSDWINGVSHDIRPQLSMVMGYAAQMEEASDLSPARRRQAGIIRTQSQVIRDLVNDLNLTMRLDCAMQAPRKEPLQIEVFLRQTAADFLNGGMGEGCDFEMDLPAEPLPMIEADPFLLRRALNNLLTNCVRHNAPGYPICLGARAEGKAIVLFVEGGVGEVTPVTAEPTGQLEADGGAAHGTGLKLVRQIAAAHGGTVRYQQLPSGGLSVSIVLPNNREV